MSSNSIRKPRSRKAADERPPKPYADFPLYTHPLGYWSKKIRGTIHHFGRWGRVVAGQLVRVEGDGWKEALEQYQVRKDDLYAGRKSRETNKDTLTVKELCNRFLTAKLRKRTSGELGSRMFEDYKQTTDLIVAAFGKDRPVDDLATDDFEKLQAEMTERWGPVRLGNVITRVKSVFKYALDNALIDKPIRFGSEFRKPEKSVMRRHRAQNGEKMLEADQLRKLIEAAGVPLRAMILLGLNAGYGNHDVATLPLSALDLKSGWLDFPRPKTGIDRRCPLWLETVAAIREVIAARPAPKEEADTDILFLMPSGRRWVRLSEKSRTDDLSVAFCKQMKTAKVHRDGIGFYTLRHVFRTVADAARDPVAIDLIMGHSDPSMGGHYRERIDDTRLNVVVDHVRSWLWPKPKDEGTTGAEDQTSVDENADAREATEPNDCDEPATLRLFAPESPETKGGAA